MNRRSFILRTGAVAATLGSMSTPSRAQAYPTRPVHLLVGGGGGSYPDLVARRVAEPLFRALGQQVVIDNRPGAGGILAMSALGSSAPDGYTLALATMSQLVFNSFIFPKLPYDPVNDIAPVGTIFSGPMVIVANPGFGPSSLPDLVEASKKQAAGINFAIPGNGSPPHIVLAMLMRVTGARFNLIPFKTGPEALGAVLSGDVPLFLDAPSIVVPNVQSGKIKAIAVTGSERLAMLPTAATVSESGYPGFKGEAWMGLVARAGTPRAIVDQLNLELARVLGLAEVHQFFDTAGSRVVTSSPEEFASLIHDDRSRWGKIIKDAAIRLE